MFKYVLLIATLILTLFTNVCASGSNSVFGVKWDSVVWGNVAQWFSAIATLAAVIIVLFKDFFLRWWRRPILAIDIEVKPPDCHKTKYSIEIISVAPATSKAQEMQGTQGYVKSSSLLNGSATSTYILSFPASGAGRIGAQGGNLASPNVISADCYYLRLKVKNTGKIPATGIQVFAAKLTDKQLGKKVHSFLPMNLLWAHSHEVYANVIHPGMYKHCDLGHVIEPSLRDSFPGEYLQGKHSDNIFLSLDLEIKANTFGHLIPPGDYDLELIVAAGNCMPKTENFEIIIPEKWISEEDVMLSEKGIRVVKVSKNRNVPTYA